jgi:hypothetical protein
VLNLDALSAVVRELILLRVPLKGRNVCGHCAGHRAPELGENVFRLRLLTRMPRLTRWRRGQIIVSSSGTHCPRYCSPH